MNAVPEIPGPVLYAGTIAGKPFREQLEAANAGGFKAISLFPQVYWGARASGLSDADMLTMLVEHEMHISALEPLLNWVPGHAYPFSSILKKHLPGETAFYRMAEAVGTHALIAVWARKKQLPESQLIDAFGALCQRAAKHGLKVHLEFLPWTQISDIEVAIRIVQQAAQPNGGVLFDTWHHYRSGTGNEKLKHTDGRLINAIQISDAPSRPSGFMALEALYGRRLPGEGDIDLVEILTFLAASGCDASIGVEVFSRKLRKMDAGTAGRRAGEALARLSQQIHTRAHADAS